MALPKYVMDIESTEYRRILVTASDDDGDPVNPTVYDVDIAFTEGGASPGVSDWHPATWVTVGSSYYARILIGPEGGLELPATDYWVYIRVAAGAEYPVKLAGYLSLQ